MTLEDAVRLLVPAGELGDAVHEVILKCQRDGLIRIEEDGTLVLTEPNGSPEGLRQRVSAECGPPRDVGVG